MSDVKGIEITDVLGLSQPLTKLIETTAAGIGKVYEPIHIQRMSKAKAKEIEVISERVNENIELPMNYDNGSIFIDATDANALVQRAQNRILFQEMKKQQNIESVVGNAYANLEGKEKVSEEPLDSDWISSFFDFIANISDSEMQVLWGKLLAGEVERPGSYSIRTLDTLRKLTIKEATIFEKIVPYVLRCWATPEKTIEDYCLLNDDILKNYNITFIDILTLNEAGLIFDNGFIGMNFEVDFGGREYIWNVDKSLAIEIKNNGSKSQKVQYSIYVLTEAGKELLSIIENSENKIDSKEYMRSCIDAMENSKDVISKPNFEFNIIEVQRQI